MATRKSSASEEIREEMREAKKGRRVSPQQAIAIGLSKARRAGKDVPPPKKGTAPDAVRKRALKDIQAGKAKRAGASKKTTAKKTAAKKQGAKKATAKKATAKKATAKKAPAKRRS